MTTNTCTIDSEAASRDSRAASSTRSVAASTMQGRCQRPEPIRIVRANRPIGSPESGIRRPSADSSCDRRLSTRSTCRTAARFESARTPSCSGATSESRQLHHGPGAGRTADRTKLETAGTRMTRRGDPAWRVRRARAGASRDRALRSCRLFGEPALARDRHSCGAWRAATIGPPAGGIQGRASGGDRTGGRGARRRCRGPLTHIDALRRQCLRRARLWRGCIGAARHCRRRQYRAGAGRVARRPGARTAQRVNAHRGLPTTLSTADSRLRTVCRAAVLISGVGSPHGSSESVFLIDRL